MFTCMHVICKHACFYMHVNRHWKPKKSGFSVSVSVLKPIMKPKPKNTKKPTFKTEKNR
jgi:hypothetical protein